ncbi:TonB-dependent hemoglobin/transferrin/lactoferrin family receptor [Caulobacter mirabilis]|uniref:TonB-dependent receptor n=1 Tax=Caulobacter mirabilis TaxID=69666 RepID=A0A2D2AZU5_9CAUL|nr:TonB-dependent hemoglobin/transferrin/lactoferrin family receptor [Caulobacter mirabilis]ATQ43515.1 TonB-dependent receptor [Caulobacter mirabilis]
MLTKTSRRLALLAAAAGAALAAAPVWADEAAAGDAATVDPVVVTATRTEKPLDEAPVTASVITDKQMDDRLVTDIKDLIKYEPGVSVRTSPARFNAAGSGTGRDGNSGFNIRGLEGNRVLIQVDGIRVPDAFDFGAQNVGRGGYADLGMIKSVEIVRGPASALYGSDGLAGAVSFFTKDPKDFLRDGRSWAAEAKAGYASADDSAYGNLVFAGESGDWSGMISYTRREGHEQETKGNKGGTGVLRTEANPQDHESNAILAKLVFTPLDGHRLRLTYDHFDNEVSTDVLSAQGTSMGVTTTQVLAHDETDRDRISLDYRYTGGSGLLSAVNAAVYYQDSTTRQYTFEDRSSVDRTRNNTFDNKVWGATVQIDSQFDTGGLSHYLVWGLDVSKTRQEMIRGGTVPTPPDVFPSRAFPNTDYTLLGLYVQDELKFFDDRLSLYPALRFDYYDLSPERDALYTGPAPKGSSDSHVSPKLGVVWSATENTKLFANIAAGFKAPAPSQVNTSFSNPLQGYTSISNPDLKPETSQTIDGGVRWSNGRLYVELAAFAGRYEDFISREVVSGAGTAVNPSVFQYVNYSEVKIRGVEAKARLRLDGGWTLMGAASGARGDAENVRGKGPLASIDPVKVVAGVAWDDPSGRYGGELSITHAAGKDESRACTGSCYTTSAFDVIDLTAYWNVTDTVTLRGGVFNLTDQKYMWWSDARGLNPAQLPPDAVTQPGRNFGLSLSLKL